MKYVIITVIVLGFIAGGITLRSNVTEYTAPLVEIKEKIVEKEVPTLEKRVADALTASSTDIEREAAEAYQARKQQLEIEIEHRITTEYRKEIEARETELQEKEMSF